MKKRKIRTILIVVIPLLLVGGYLVNKFLLNQNDIPSDAHPTPATQQGGRGGGGGGRAIPVTVAVVELEPIYDGITVAGTIKPNEEVDLSGEIAGKIVSINFQEGSKVKKGDVLVQINDDDLQAQLKRYEFQQENLHRKLERQRVLFEREAISGEAFDQVQTEYNMLLADIDLLKVRINRCKIKAPFDGVVGFRSVSEGSYLQAGAKVARLVDNDKLKLEFSIPERYKYLPLVGSTIFFTNGAFEGKRFSAKIYAMEPRNDENTRSIVLRALHNNSDNKFVPGMYLSVTIPTSETASAMMIPTEAVISAIDSKSVWVVRSGRPVQTNIETGMRLADKIEVTKGLQVGDSVVITGLMQMREGAQIKVTN
ncbi:putative Co/Zn/Cd efflux system membrane fusion protein [Mucinivorans hirudinis]|uniref:Putative Co/Zn/Cd efflux system membrane fusion protein n=1 Tax=Mucinivorans hirudinis TaxID=1433126 RepID=A0A060RBE4_9BACT|nr:putative Co/Zn/Cd efflux system membrane fusion protein [Mucinivorans hirudinis]